MKPVLIRLGLALLLSGVVLLGGFFFYSSNRAPDDAYISLRYAENLAGGEGLRFNPGGERVEGFSSPLHVLLMGSAIALGAPPLHVSQFSSLLGAFLCVGLVAWWGQKRLGRWWGTLAALSLALNPSLGFWSRGGLETTLFATLVTGTFIAAAEKRWKLMGLAAGALAVTQPEGPLYWAVLVLYVLLRHRDELKAFLAPGLLVLASWAPWFLFRLLYFHDVLPNTYYAKMDGVRSAQVHRGFSYLGGFFSRSEIMLPIALIVLGLVAAWWGHRNGKRPIPDWVYSAGFLGLATTGFGVLSGGDHMNHNRFLIPAIPLIMVLGVWSVSRVASLPARRSARSFLGVALGFLFMSQPIRIASHDLRHPTFPLDRPIGLVEPFDDWPIPHFFRLGRELKNTLPSDTVIAVIPAGALPYASGFTTIDMLGLNDRQIAKQPVEGMGMGRMGHEKGNGDLVLKRKPDVILMRHDLNTGQDTVCEPGPDDLAYRPINDIWHSEVFQRDYEAFIVDIGSGKSFTLYRRRTDIP